MKKSNKEESKVKTNTYNYPPDSHKEFCKRCLKYNNSICPITQKTVVSYTCNI